MRYLNLVSRSPVAVTFSARRLELRDDINHDCEGNLCNLVHRHPTDMIGNLHERNVTIKGETLTGRKQSAGYFQSVVEFPAGTSENIHLAGGESEV